jgi:hypothetical protein
VVNRSITWASWDDELLALELQELNEAEFDLSLIGFDPGKIDKLLIAPEDDEKANAAPPLPENPVSAWYPARAIFGFEASTGCSAEIDQPGRGSAAAG